MSSTGYSISRKMQPVRFLCTIGPVQNYFGGPIDQTGNPVSTWVSDSVVFQMPPQGQPGRPGFPNS